jgi:REP element-mobilizing transposase RayT
MRSLVMEVVSPGRHPIAPPSSEGWRAIPLCGLRPPLNEVVSYRSDHGRLADDCWFVVILAARRGSPRNLHLNSLIKKPKQLELLKSDLRFFGGRLLHGRRRRQRPLSIKDAIHLVLRSSWAFGLNSFLKVHNKNAIEKIIAAAAEKYGVRIYRKAIASNHVHLIIRIHSRSLYRTFIRVLAGKIAAHVMKGQSFKVFRKHLRGDPPEIQGNGQAFWQFRPFTRLLHWGRDYTKCCAYLKQNTLEALGFIGYKPRKNSYGRWIEEILINPRAGSG